jgi:hypothetical protein
MDAVMYIYVLPVAKSWEMVSLIPVWKTEDLGHGF